MAIGGLLVLIFTKPKKKNNVVQFRKRGIKAGERNPLDTVYNPKQYRRPRKTK